MILSTHYYVLSLGTRETTLFEAFRDFLIEVENQGFPVVTPWAASQSSNTGQLLELARTIDRCFDHHYTLDPLRLVLVGEKDILSAFVAVTKHSPAVIRSVEGDHTTTSARDLGQIVWPIVKEAMSGVLDKAMWDLEISAEQGELASGIDAVIRLVNKEFKATLVVEDDFHVKGSIHGTNGAPIITPDVDVRDVIDDVIDAVIEKVLDFGGNVVFAPNDSLIDRNRIVFLLHGVERSR